MAERRLRILAEAVHLFAAATTDYPALLDTIARRTAEVTESYCAIGLLTEDRRYWERVAAHDPDPVALAFINGLPESRRIPIGTKGTLTGLVLERQAEVWLHDLAQPGATDAEVLASLHPRFLEVMREQHLSSLLCVPLLAHGEVFGTLMVARHGPQLSPLQPHDIDLVRSLADHASLAITNARSLVKAKRELAHRVRLSEQLQFLSELSRVLAAWTQNPPLLLDLVARRCAEWFGDLCSIRLLAPEAARQATAPEMRPFEPAVLWHTDPEILSIAREVTHSGTLRVGEGIVGSVVATGQSLVMAQVAAEELSARTPMVFRTQLERLGVSSLMCVPLVAAGQLIGTISMSRLQRALAEQQPYTEEDARILHDVADHLGLALANGRLVGRLREELSERERAQIALQHAEEQLRHSQKMDAIGRLAGGVAHDFNNLLSVILSYSDMLLADLPPGDPRAVDLGEIRGAGQRAAELTHQLLAFSRQQVLEPSMVDLNEVLTKMDRMIRRLVGEDITVRTIVADPLGRVRVDPTHIDQVLMNLVVNARDAMPVGGSLVIEAGNVDLDADYASDHPGTRSGPHVMLAISDTGTGMDPITRERIFEPFFTTKGTGKGTGLGLSTVYGIVKQNGGSIWVYSEPGCGTTFKIYLPQAEGTAEVPVASRALTAVEGGTETILLVEDDDQVRTLARGILARNGYRVLDAGSVRAAVELGHGHPQGIDLLLTDVVMPEMNGLRLAERLSASQPAMKVLFMSGYTANAIVHHHELEAGRLLLQKPIIPDSLLRKVREALSNR